MKRILLAVFLVITHTSFAQTWLWAKEGTGLLGGGEGMSTAIDNSNNLLFAGYNIGTQIFNPYTLNCNMPYGNAILVKYDPNGNVLWAHYAVSSAYSFSKINSVAVDKNGNSYVAGIFSDTVNFGAKRIIGRDMTYWLDFGVFFLAKYNPSGNAIWAVSGSVPSLHSYTKLGELQIALDDQANIYITGTGNDTLTFGTHTLHNVGGYIFVAKYDSSGNVIWAKQSSQSVMAGTAIATEKTGKSYVTGRFQGSVSFGTHAINCAYSGNDAYLAKYDSAGSVLWAVATTLTNNSGSACGTGVVTDNQGHEYMTGYFKNTVKIGNTTLNTSASNTTSIFLAKYDSSGNAIWVKQFNNIDFKNWTSYSVALDTLQHIYLFGAGGANNAELVYGTDTMKVYIPGNGSADAASFIAQFDTSGKMLCNSIVSCGGDDINDPIGGLCVSPNGSNLYVGADIWQYSAVIGNDTLTSSGSENPYVAKWLPCSIADEVKEVSMQVHDILVYPNPSNGQFNVRFDAEKLNEEKIIEVYNVLGEKVFSNSRNIENSAINIDLTNQPNGIYFYQITGETGGLVGEGKLIIEK